MNFLAVLGIVAIVVGFLGLFHVISLSFAVALVVIVSGVLLVVFGGGYVRRN